MFELLFDDVSDSLSRSDELDDFDLDDWSDFEVEEDDAALDRALDEEILRNPYANF